MEHMGVDEFCDYLLEEKKFHSDVVTSFHRNRITGATFLGLSEDDLRDLVPVIGDRVIVRKLLVEMREETDKDGQVCVQQQSSSSPPTAKDCSSAPSLAADCSTLSVSIPSSQPADWHLHFSIPERESFSGSVQRAIDTGVVCSKARREIIQVLRTLIAMHTLYPVSDQYVTICQKLIAKFPKLRDPIGTNGFGSWRMSLRNSFKNFRRDHPVDENGERIYRPVSSRKAEPPCKRMKPCTNDDELGLDDNDDVSYEDMIGELQTEYRKGRKGRNHALLKQLMEKTRNGRRRWIETEKPLVCEIVEKFPCLATSRGLRREFRAVSSLEATASSLMDLWPEWQKKLTEFSKVESATRPILKKLLSTMDKKDSAACPDDCYNSICLDLLTRLLYPRGIGKNAVFIKQFETTDVNLDAEVAQIEQSAPFLVFTGRAGDESAQYFVCCEQIVIAECKTVKDAVIDLVAAYYVFDIAYPKCISAILLFFQHVIFGLKDSQALPVTTSNLVSNLSKF